MKTIIILCMLIIAESALAGTYVDNFDDGKLNGWERIQIIDRGKIEEKNGKLIITDIDRSGVTLAFFNNGQVVRDFILITDINMAKADAGNTYLWIVFRYTDVAWGIFSFEMDNQTNVLSIFKIEGAGFRWDIGKVDIPFVFELGRTYHIKLEMIGAKATIWIDDKQMAKADWTNQPALPKEGQIALGGGGGELQFDNFMITGEDIQNSGEYSVNRKDKLAASWGNIKAIATNRI